ncbi:MAG: acyl-CoA dehydrogenase family protein [Chloroflexota bacterium]
MVTAPLPQPIVLQDVQRDVAGVAADHAVAVDRDARFPYEFLSAAKQARLLGAYIPAELGGFGCSIADLSAMCTAVGQSCSASGMVLAMHHIQVACLVHHGRTEPTLREYLADLADGQFLIASVTSEAGVGGDIRSSVCALEPAPRGYVLTKNAATISYGEYADDLLVTTRRASDAAASDQVLVLVRKSDFTLERKSSWDTVGMRGTCSPSFRMTSQVECGNVLQTPFADIASQTMVPVSHILWASTWLGIAMSAVSLARACVREQARKTPGIVPPASLRLAELSSELQAMRNGIRALTAEYQEMLCSPDGFQHALTVGFALKANNLKLAASRQVVEIVHGAMLICGIAGYKNDSPFALGRQLRDSLSAALMVSNDRILAANASLLLVSKDQ